jgi:methylmalonyl-CoA mutase
MATNLFDDFDPVSSKQWKSSLNLRGRLQRNLNLQRDIKVKPFIIEMSLQSTCCNKASEFKICQNIFVFDIEKSVERAWTRKGRRQSPFYNRR